MKDTRHPAKRRLACPKCGHRELILTEKIVCITIFQHYENGTIDDEGFHETGDYFMVTGTCDRCCHEWRIRRAVQITDLRDDGAEAVR